MSRYLFTPEDDVTLLRETLDELLYSFEDPDNQYHREIKAQAARRLNEVRKRLSGQAEQGYETLKHAACWTDNYLHHNPWQSIGISTAAGITVGFILARCTLSD